MCSTGAVPSPLTRFVFLILASTVLTAPTTAAAAPPANDNYLDSVPINAPATRLTREEVKDARDTREATVQADLFAPKATGGGAEQTRCDNRPFGKTIWYDFHPDSYGTVELQTAGFDTVLAVYEFDRNTSRITRTAGCQDEPGVTEDFFLEVVKGRSYTLQIGGADAGMGPASGDLQFTFQFFGDLDRDGIFDPLDRCPSLAGVQARGGCPPEVRSTPKLTAASTGSGIQVRRLTVATTRGARVSLRCRRGCSKRETRTSRGTVTLRSVGGLALSAGAQFDIRVTRRGYIGAVHRYTVTRGNFRRVDRCTLPGSRKVRTRCP